MITVRVTDGKSFAIPFTCENHIALRHGCRVAFRHLVAIHGERHMQTQSKLNNALHEIDEWLAAKLVEPGRCNNDISSLHSTAIKLRSDRKNGIFYGKKDPDFYLLPDTLQLHVLDQYTSGPFDSAGMRGYWIAAGDYAAPGEMRQDNRCGTNIHVWRKIIGHDYKLIYPDNSITLSDSIDNWERIWLKCISADHHARSISTLCDWVADEATKITTPLTNPNRAKFYLINGGNNGR